jgi:hypothetical protein
MLNWSRLFSQRFSSSCSRMSQGPDEQRPFFQQISECPCEESKVPDELTVISCKP